MGGEWCVTDESVKAMQNMSKELEVKITEILTAIAELIDSYEENKDGLGYHSSEILNLLSDLRTTTDEANEPVKKLVLKLRKAAAIRNAHIQKQAYQSTKGRSR